MQTPSGVGVDTGQGMLRMTFGGCLDANEVAAQLSRACRGNRSALLVFDREPGTMKPDETLTITPPPFEERAAAFREALKKLQQQHALTLTHEDVHGMFYLEDNRSKLIEKL